MKEQNSNNYTQAILQIKTAILRSRYLAARVVNREQLSLYYGIGKYISENSRNGFWGTSAIETISERLQQELPGLRGFSAANIKRMRTFFEQWCEYIENLTLSTYNFATNIGNENRPMPSDEIQTNILMANRPMPSDDLYRIDLHSFWAIGFSHHYEILLKTNTLEERLFYIERSATEFWSVEKLKYNLKNDLYTRQGKILNNFQTTISDKDLQRKALLAFKDEYLFDYINIESSDDEPDERMLESSIVANIQKFIMSLGKDFSFIGNQYRLIVEEQEYFIDLLFFNRRLQCLVAIELKRGDFKPEYLGKMNFYLSALDDFVRLPHENRSIGIIICKTQKQNIVEYAFRDFTKPMGVATYKTASELPEEYKNILPSIEQLKQLL